MAIDPMTLSMGFSAGSSLLGGLFGSSSAKKAAKQQQAAAEAAMNEQRRQYDTTRQDLAPWRQTGAQAIDRLGMLLGLGNPTRNDSGVQAAEQAYQAAQAEYNALLQPAQSMDSRALGAMLGYRDWSGDGDLSANADWDHAANALKGRGTVDSGALDAARKRLDDARNALNAARSSAQTPGEYGSLLKPFGMEDFQVDPGYQFRQSEGMKGIENSAAARGMQLSGSNLKDLTRFNQGLASDEYSRAFGRDALEKDRTYNYLSGTSSAGQNAAAQTAQFGQMGTNNISDLYTQMGNSQAAGTIGGANALSNAFTNAGNSLTDYMALKSLIRKN